MRFTQSRLSLSIATVCGLAATPIASATTINGVVKDINGDPVKGATIKVEGTSKTAFTDASGEYQLTLNEKEADSHIHIHVYSAKHLHGDNDLGFVEDDQTVNFTLSPVVFENVLVTANALETSVLESITPVTVLGAETLRKRQAPTLGETLKMTPGVHSTYFAGVASSPIIRGNDGPRVKIVQNGLDVSDVSRVGPDHAVASDASSATQIEVLRGPASLQYGSGAIGGVVNIVDNRIPTYLNPELSGEAEVRYATVNEEKFAKVDLNKSVGNFAFHLDGFTRKTDDIEIPGFAELDPHEEDEAGLIEGSSVDTDNLVGGLSYIGDEGYVGFSVQRLNNFYGVPGHAHGHEEEHHEDEEEHEGEEEHGHDEGEESVNIDAKLDRYQLAGKWYSPFEGITSIGFSAAYSEYEHAEIEGDELGTQFTNDGIEVRTDIRHEDIGGWHGVVGFQYANSDYTAVGEEAFTPPAETDSYAVFVLEEKRLEDFTLQAGARIERTEYAADDVLLSFELGEHHDEDEGEEHDEEEHEEELELVSFEDYGFTAVSASIGANWHYDEQSSLAVSLSRSERAPSQQELFSGGAHLATRTYELGLVFDVDEEGDIVSTAGNVEKEVSTNLDVTWRKYYADWGFSASIFYSGVDDYIYQEDSGFVFADSHGEEHHDEEDEGEHDEEHADEHEEEGLPVLVFQQNDATLYGFEFDGHYDINLNWRVSLFGDYIRANIDSDDLPRIPPLRLGAAVQYQWQGWDADIEATWYDDQDRTATFETPTDGYTLVNIGATYTTMLSDMEWQVFARAENVFDEEARVHSSFLKNEAPLPGRNFQIGVRTYF
ncbi:TonB-dependent receptor [Alteromonas oceanisediminis]|uniref:TonB-dependent receptor n=1 Tax=Alteromonas oceanisediminis TaxID=2836180 RepID=UPI001BDB51DF|nr:TonB-dependent receptor [Alteromonas oceanisediminis]MBT0585343.1 TonB-dependent receptor [Alteromonas oceanisediminis]